MDIDELKKLFQIHLRKKGLYLTQTRLSILEAIARQARPFEARELWTALQLQRIGPSTVYRTLALCVQAGLVRKRPGKTDTYECVVRKTETEYLHCTACGDWVPFPGVALTGELLAIAQERGFTVRAIQLSVEGTCRNCRWRDNEGQPPPHPPNREGP